MNSILTFFCLIVTDLLAKFLSEFFDLAFKAFVVGHQKRSLFVERGNLGLQLLCLLFVVCLHGLLVLCQFLHKLKIQIDMISPTARLILQSPPPIQFPHRWIVVGGFVLGSQLSRETIPLSGDVALKKVLLLLFCYQKLFFIWLTSSTRANLRSRSNRSRAFSAHLRLRFCSASCPFRMS